MGLSKKTKTRIIYSVISGLFFAAAMSGLDYYKDTPFNLNKFIFHFAFFGLFQGIVSGFYIIKNKDQNKNS